MTDLKTQIHEDMKTAMRAKDKPRLAAIRLIIAAIKQIEIDTRTELDDAGTVKVLQKTAKQRRQSITEYQAAERQDLADKEQFELDIIQAYLPPALDAATVDTLIQEAISATGAQSLKDMGKVMAQLKSKLEGRADLSDVSAKLKNILGS